MPDICVTVPQRLWEEWQLEGDLPGDPETGDRYAFYLAGGAPDIQPGERVYVVAWGRLRGYAPLIEIKRHPSGACALIRGGGAVAVTIDREIRGFQGFRYRDWDREEEVAFPGWREVNVGEARGQGALRLEEGCPGE